MTQMRVRRSLLIYVPAALLVLAALMLPSTGRDLIGRNNAREFVLLLAFWWMILSVAGRVLYGVIMYSGKPRESARGFEVIREDKDHSHVNKAGYDEGRGGQTP